jgi:hypothetical protein
VPLATAPAARYARAWPLRVGYAVDMDRADRAVGKIESGEREG